GPDNPMGLYALYVGRMYAIHGTNAKFGIGLRVSHGCVRLRNEDIEYLFKKVPVGTRVQFVNQPVKTTVEPGGLRYMEVHQPLSRSEAEFNSDIPAPLPMTPAVTRFIAHKETDSRLVKQALEQRSGMPLQINPA
ncbi:L,D-transpeptidase family protein, partial [Aeromonas schubertii]